MYLITTNLWQSAYPNEFCKWHCQTQLMWSASQYLLILVNINIQSAMRIHRSNSLCKCIREISNFVSTDFGLPLSGGGVSAGSTHLPLGLHIFMSESGQHWFRWWLVAYSSPSHYLNDHWVIINRIPGNKLQWNFNHNTKFLSQKCIWKYCLLNGGHFVPGEMS